MMADGEILYIGDPLCSWCWGISYHYQQLVNKYNDRFTSRILLGGLRPGTTEPMDLKTKEYIRQHWGHVHEASGQPFNYDLLKKDSVFVYDTEVPSRAVIVVRELSPENTFEFFKDVQYTFYVENKDTNLEDTYYPLINKYNIEQQLFSNQFNSAEKKKQCYEDFAKARQYDITGFPSVVFTYKDDLYALALGYSTFEKMDKIISEVIA